MLNKYDKLDTKNLVESDKIKFKIIKYIDDMYNDKYHRYENDLITHVKFFNEYAKNNSREDIESLEFEISNIYYYSFSAKKMFNKNNFYKKHFSYIQAQFNDNKNTVMRIIPHHRYYFRFFYFLNLILIYPKNHILLYLVLYQTYRVPLSYKLG